MSPSKTGSSDPGSIPARLEAAHLSLVEVRCALCGSDEAEPAAHGYDFEYRTVSNDFRFVRCLTCAHLYLNPRPAATDLQAIYPSNYYSLSGPKNPIVARAQRIWEGRKVRGYRELIGTGRRRILDVGCGNGRFLSVLQEFGPPEWDLVGIDFDEKAVKRCRSAGFEAYVSRVEEFSPDSSDFDAVIMLQLIEHVEDPRRICRRIFELLRPGGVVVIETPNPAGLDYRIFEGRHWGHYHFPRHWNLFSKPALHRLLEDCGFTISRSDALLSTSAWAVSLHNYFFDKGFPNWFVRFFSYQNPVLLTIFVILDTARARLGFETSNQRMIARKPGA